MTIEEFDNQQFGKNMRAMHINCGKCLITGVDFEEKLIEVIIDDLYGSSWCRCENIELLKSKKETR